MSITKATTPPLWKVKVAISSYFITVGFILGNWVARIPDVKEEHKLSDGLFGVVLVTGIFGAMLCLPVVTPIIERYGSSAGSLYGALATLVLVPIIGVTKFGISLLIVGIMGLGFGMGMVDVSMNAQGTTFEMLSGTHAFGLFHASYAIGGFLGALVGGVLAQQGVVPIRNFILVSLCCLPLCFGMNWWMIGKASEVEILKTFRDGTSDHTILPSADDSNTHKPVNSGTESSLTEKLISEDTVISSSSLDQSDLDKTTEISNVSLCSSKPNAGQLRLMCAIAFVASLGEGAINDWSTIYFVETLESSSLIAAIGYAAFELMLAAGRLYSDHLLTIYSGRSMLMIAGIVSAVGLAMVITAPSFSTDTVRTVTAIIGFAICGAGVSVCSPLVTHLCSRLAGISPTGAIAQLTTCVYLAMMIGPPLIGGLSSLLGGLRWAFIMITTLFLCIFLFAAPMRRPELSSLSEEDVKV